MDELDGSQVVVSRFPNPLAFVKSGEVVGANKPHSIAFWGVFPHYKGDLNTIQFTTSRSAALTHPPAFGTCFGDTFYDTFFTLFLGHFFTWSNGCSSRHSLSPPSVRSHCRSQLVSRSSLMVSSTSGEQDATSSVFVQLIRM